ncbi:MAG: hypothetical protein NZL90_05225 [Aquificaceae bacterium]|nr:hypothetical protein [Aquificaceae bacterium]MDW8236790.1 hypothetical protein [Aquificaceae bacterium]
MIELSYRDYVERLALEVFDDPSKKEHLFYLICYIQAVRREGRFLVELDRFLSCARTHIKHGKFSWRDVLVELDFFVFCDISGNQFMGKDIYAMPSDTIILLSVKGELRPQFELLSYRLLKLWGILSRLCFTKTPLGIQESLAFCVNAFNEGLYKEASSYAQICSDRFRNESQFFKALSELCEFYILGSEDHLKRAYMFLQNVKPIYFRINVQGLSEQVANLVKDIQRGRPAWPIRIEYSSKREGFLRKFIGYIKYLFKNARNKGFFLPHPFVRSCF